MVCRIHKRIILSHGLPVGRNSTITVTHIKATGSISEDTTIIWLMELLRLLQILVLLFVLTVVLPLLLPLVLLWLLPHFSLRLVTTKSYTLRTYTRQYEQIHRT